MEVMELLARPHPEIRTTEEDDELEKVSATDATVHAFISHIATAKTTAPNPTTTTSDRLVYSAKHLTSHKWKILMVSELKAFFKVLIYMYGYY